MPLYDRRWNLIAQRIGQNSRMVARGTHFGGDALLDIGCALPVVEKAHILIGPKVHHHSQTVPLSGVEERTRRSRVDADRVDLVLRHLSEIPLGHLLFVILVSVCVGTKGSIRDTTEVKLLFTNPNEFSSYARANRGLNRR